MDALFNAAWRYGLAARLDDGESLPDLAEPPSRSRRDMLLWVMERETRNLQDPALKAEAEEKLRHLKSRWRVP
jgi:hypothetical protein